MTQRSDVGTVSSVTLTVRCSSAEACADEVIDFTNTDFAHILTGYDVVLDSLGGTNLRKSLAVLNPAVWLSVWSARPILLSPGKSASRCWRQLWR